MIYMAPKNAIYLGQTKPNKITLITLQVTDNSLYKPYIYFAIGQHARHLLYNTNFYLNANDTPVTKFSCKFVYSFHGNSVPG